MTPIRTALALLLAASVARADVGPAGAEFQVNTYTTGFQGNAKVAVDPSGGFVVVWQSGYYYGTSQDGSLSGVFGRRFDAGGAPQSGEFQVNTSTLGSQFSPSIAKDAAGNFVVAWESGSRSYYSYGVHPDGSASGVFVQRFNALGAKTGSEFPANTTTRGRQGSPAVASDSAGNFVVVWQGGGYRFPLDGSGPGIFGQRFDAGGAPLGPEFQVNTYTTGAQELPAVAMDALGDFVVVWQSGYYSNSQDGSSAGVFGRRFDSAGTPQGDDFQVNTYTTGPQQLPQVASDPLGNFVVVWQSGGYNAQQDGDRSGVFGQRFDMSGVPIGGEFQANTYTTGDQSLPSVASDQDGNFVVTWNSSSYYGLGQDGSSTGVFGQHFGASGAPIGPEFQVNTHTNGAQNNPSIGATPGGDFVVVWESGGYPPQDGSNDGVFGQRLRTTAFGPPDPVAGNRVALHDDPLDPRRKTLAVRSDDAGIDLGGGLGSIDDPTVDGGHLRVLGATFDDTYDLPSANWRASGAGARLAYLYRDSPLLDGPVQSVRVRHGRFKITAKGAQLGHSLAMNPYPVTIVLQIGDRGQRYCAQFGGTVYYRPDVVFRARSAAAPGACPR